MPKKVYVTSAQRSAAKTLVSRSAKTGRYVSQAVNRIADADGTTRSAKSGRYVSATAAARNPTTTVSERS